MRSMPQALLWETLSHGRWSLPAFFLLGNAMPLLVYGSLSFIGVNPSDPAFIVLQMSFLPLIIFQFAIGIVTAQGPMARLYTAPISAISIVAWHMFSGAVLLGFETALAASLYNALFDAGWPVLTPALFAAAAWSAFQLLLCVSTRQPLTGLSIAGLSGLGLFLWLKSRYGPWYSTPKHYWSEVTATECATLIGVIAVSYVATVLAVNRTRCGDSLPTLNIGNWIAKIWEAVTSRADTNLPPFRSEAHAQFWYEWKLKGGAFPLAVAFLLTVVGIGWLVDFAFSDATLAGLYEGILFCGGILSMIAVLAGAMLGMSDTNTPRQREVTLADVSGKFETMGHFQATRPLKNIDFAKAILKVAALSGFIAWGLWSTLFAIYLIGLWNAGQLPDPILPAKIGAWYLPLTILGPWIVMANVAAVGLSGRSAVFATAIVSLTFLTVILEIVLQKYSSPSVLEAIFWTFTVVACGAIVSAALWAFVTASRRKILTSKAVVTAAIVFCSIVIAAIVLKPFAMFFAATIVVLAFAALVVMPVATVPLAIGWNRHR